MQLIRLLLPSLWWYAFFFYSFSVYMRCVSRAMQRTQRKIMTENKMNTKKNFINITSVWRWGGRVSSTVSLRDKTPNSTVLFFEQRDLHILATCLSICQVIWWQPFILSLIFFFLRILHNLCSVLKVICMKGRISLDRRVGKSDSYGANRVCFLLWTKQISRLLTFQLVVELWLCFLARCRYISCQQPQLNQKWKFFNFLICHHASTIHCSFQLIHISLFI